MTRKSHQRTVGTLISTVCYFVLAAFFALQAKDYIDAGYGLRGWGLGVCALACFAGGLRFVIHDLVEKLGRFAVKSLSKFRISVMAASIFHHL